MRTCLFSFIPLSRWPLIVASIFDLHNETRMYFFLECPAITDDMLAHLAK